MGDAPLLILGGSVNALWVARSMARSGVEVHAVSDGLSSSLVRHSRYLSSFHHVGSSSSAQQEWLEWLPSGPSGAVVLPCGDPGVEFVARYRSTLCELGYLPIEADDDVNLAMLDKARTYALARRLEVEAPHSLLVDADHGLPAEARGVSFPCALKPLHSHRSTMRLAAKAVVVRDGEELERQCQRLARMGVEAMLTEIVPGPEDSYCSYYTYLDEGGQPLVHFTKRKLRQYPLGFGWGCCHETAWEPEAAEVGLRFLRGVGLRGLGYVEFKRDQSDGRLKLIECNPRLSAANELVRLAGIDFARLAYDRARGRPGPVLGSFVTGLREWHPLDDTRACLSLWRLGQLSLRRWASTVAPPVHLPIFDPHDPSPSLRAGLDRARRIARRGMASATKLERRRD